MMFKPIFVLRRVLLAVLIAGLTLPVRSGLAAPLLDEGDPPQERLSKERLEQIWARETALYERTGTLLERAETLIARVQAGIQKAEERGIDTSTVQAALEAFSGALQDARPIYQSAHGIVQSHQGFDESGQVTERAQAIETVRDLGAKLRQVKAALGGTGQALRQAVHALWEANRPDGAPAP